MTYKHLKAFLEENNQNNYSNFFDLIPTGIKSKIILVVGKGSSNTAAYLSSIMTCLNISHSKYINAKKLELKNRFIANNTHIEIKELCETSASIIKKSKRAIASDELCFLLSLLLLDGVGEYIIIEMSDSLYLRVAEKSIILPHAVIFSTLDDILSNKQKEFVFAGTKEIIFLSERDNYSYISNETNKNGIRINTVSSNKIVSYKTNIMGTDFYYNNQLYHISSIDQNNIPLACLAVECAKNLFTTTYALTYKGLDSTKVPFDFELYSISPIILLRIDGYDFRLSKKMKFNIITENDNFQKPTENTIFCGNSEFIDLIKDKLK